MTCKYFKTRWETVPEIGSMTPNIFEIKYCALGRNEIGMMPKCEATPYNGRCWQERQEQQE